MDETDVRAACDLFGLGAPRGAPVAVGGGLTNRLWRLTAARGTFAVKEINRDLERPDWVAWFDRAFSLEQAAFRAGLPMPRPVPVAATGRCLGEITRADGRMVTVRVHAWVEAVKLDNGVAYPAGVAGRIAAMLARIHGLRMTSDAPATEALRVFGGEHWRGLAARAAREDAAWAAELAGLLPALADLEAYVRAAHGDATPLLLSHRDADAKNVMRTPEGDLLLVDWDAAGPVNPRHDLADHALVWAGVHRGDPDAAVARAFIDAYRRAGGRDERFRPTDLAELVSARLRWFNFNVRRALGERLRDEEDRLAGESALRRNVTELPRFARSLDAWLAVLRD